MGGASASDGGIDRQVPRAPAKLPVALEYGLPSKLGCNGPSLISIMLINPTGTGRSIPESESDGRRGRHRSLRNAGARIPAIADGPGRGRPGQRLRPWGEVAGLDRQMPGFHPEAVWF